MMKPVLNTMGFWPQLFGKHAERAKEVALLLALNIPMTVVKTLMHGKAYAQEGFSKDDQRLLFTQEWIRQSISTVLWLGSLMTSYVVVEKFFPKQSQLGKLITTNLLSSIPDAFVRPFLTAKLSRSFLGEKPQPVASQPRISKDDLARFQSLMQSSRPPEPVVEQPSPVQTTPQTTYGYPYSSPYYAYSAYTGWN